MRTWGCPLYILVLTRVCWSAEGLGLEPSLALAWNHIGVQGAAFECNSQLPKIWFSSSSFFSDLQCYSGQGLIHLFAFTNIF